MRSCVSTCCLVLLFVISFPLLFCGSNALGGRRVMRHNSAAAQGEDGPLPVVLWHGMGDTCCYSFSMGAIKKLIEEQVPGVYVKSIEIGNTIEEDEYNGFFLNANKQIDMVCQNLSSDPLLANGFNAIGFSQGGQFLRAYVERCNSPPVYNLISIGGQHQGVYGMPRCPGANSTLCNIARELLNIGAYVGFVQEHLVQAEYWQDPFQLDEYLEKSVFLADINNARPQKNQTYKENMLKLNSFVMVMFTKDTMVQPRISEWFGFYAEGSAVETVTLQETDLYKEDWLGLQELDNRKALFFIPCDGDHLRFTDEWFIDNIVPFLNGKQ